MSFILAIIHHLTISYRFLLGTPPSPIDMDDFLDRATSTSSPPPSPMDLSYFLDDSQQSNRFVSTRLPSPIDIESVLGEFIEESCPANHSSALTIGTPPSPIDMSLFSATPPPCPPNLTYIQSNTMHPRSIPLHIAHSNPPSPIPLDEFMASSTDPKPPPCDHLVIAPIRLSHSDPPSPLPLDEFMDNFTDLLESALPRPTRSDPPSPIPLAEFMEDPTNLVGTSSCDHPAIAPICLSHSDPPSPLPLDEFMDDFTDLLESASPRPNHSDPPSPLPLDEFMDDFTDLAARAPDCLESAPLPSTRSDPPSPISLSEFMEDPTDLEGTSPDNVSEGAVRSKGTPASRTSSSRLGHDTTGDQILMCSHRKLFDTDGKRWSSLYASQEPGVGWSSDVLNLFATEIWFRRYSTFWRNPIMNWSFVDMPHASLKLCKPRVVKPEDISFAKLTSMLLQHTTITVCSVFMRPYLYLTMLTHDSPKRISRSWKKLRSKVPVVSHDFLPALQREQI